MMLIGYVIAEKEEKLKRIPLWILISGTLISVLLMFLTECFNVGGYCIVQPFILLSSTLVFLLGLRKPGWYIFKPVSVLGQQASLYVYLFHYMIIVIISRLAEGSPLPSWSISLIVVVVSLIFARALSVTIRLIKSNSRSGS
jgi:peptidoglycan/LPS O-acetylase OafA/YrhL